MLGLDRIRVLQRDAKILYATRAIRLFGYGLIGVLLVLYMKALGLRDDDIGGFLMLTLLGDCLVSLLVAANADVLGNRFMLRLGAMSMCLTGVLFGVFPTFVAFDEWLGKTGDTAADMESWKGWLYFILILILGTVGVISPSGTEVGPFQAIEQSLLAKFVPMEQRATLFAWYTLVGSFMTALGSLVSGMMISFLTETSLWGAVYAVSASVDERAPSFGAIQSLMNGSIPGEPAGNPGDDEHHFSKLVAYRAMVVLYGVVGFVLFLAFSRLDPNVEGRDSVVDEAVRLRHEDIAPQRNVRAANESLGEDSPLLTPCRERQPSLVPGMSLSPDLRWTVFKLCLLFVLDSFGSSMMNGSLLAYWFSQKYHVDEAYLGSLLFVSNILCGISALLAGAISQNIGLVNTMVFTHLPSNLLMMMVPFAPNLFWATTLIFLRSSISQMDVGPRTAYISSIFPSHERTGVLGLITTVRTLGAAFGPLLTGYLADKGMFDFCFIVGGGLSGLYDLLLLFSFGGRRVVE
ncbi:major facilitator superfamily domain-containing protein [Chytriomyces sp. MP71]|nr:major facilitator superfamily domain-containing protein [Chytriomyces sp. MP71]